MNKSFFNMLFVGITIFGTLVGAGFASGKEIWFYFARFGNFAFVMAFLVCVLFFFACRLFFSFGKKFAVASVQDCTFVCFKKFSVVAEIILIFSNLVLLSSMFAGADSLFEIVMPNFPYRLAGVLSALLTLFVVCFGFRGVTKTNFFIVPLLLVMIVLVLVFCFFDGRTTFSPPQTSAKSALESVFYGLLFLGSNMFFSGFVFARMGKEFSKKELVGGTIFGCIFLFLALVLLITLLFTNQSALASDMPVVDIALSLNFPLGLASLVVIWLGLLTTAFAMLYTISNWLKSFFSSTILATSIASVLALLMSGIGFGLFVKVIYPIMGVFGFVFMFFVWLAQKKKNAKKHLKTQKKSDPSITF